MALEYNDITISSVGHVSLRILSGKPFFPLKHKTEDGEKGYKLYGKKKNFISSFKIRRIISNANNFKGLKLS